jgi:tRNA/tmRNA/rRNA uracil-C5-methylase (TrmA/RlmC/RlmD family)
LALRAYVDETIRGAAPQTLFDVYGGVGDYLAPHVETLARGILIESGHAAAQVASARFAAHAHVSVHADRAEAALPTLLNERSREQSSRHDCALAILNPPRTGLDGAVTDALEHAAQSRAVQRLIYVSCDPATLARDVSRLPSWRVTQLQPFDMFPHTAHVETVCVLTAEPTHS